MTEYYTRQATTFVDGSPIFKTEQDERNERTTAQEIETAWQCSLHSFGQLAPIDWYAVRDGRLVGLLELKTRQHPRDKYRTVFLNIRKWLALTLTSIGVGVPSVYVVRFTDSLCWIRVSQVDPRNMRIGGCLGIVKSRNDVEPVIEVPVNTLHLLRGA